MCVCVLGHSHGAIRNVFVIEVGLGISGVGIKTWEDLDEAMLTK